MKTILVVAHFILLAFLGTSVSAETISDLLDRHSLELRAQRFEKDCGPVSLFNAMILGPQSVRKSLLKLPGKRHDDKYRSLMSLYGTKPSQFDSSSPRYKPDLGIDLRDLAAMGNDVIAGQNVHFESKFASQTKTPFTTTLADLNASITMGIAPVLAVSFQTPSDSAQAAAGHAVMVIQIMSIDDTQKKAVLKILDPDALGVKLMEVVEDSRGLLEATAPNIWPAELPAGIMTLDSYIVLEN